MRELHWYDWAQLVVGVVCVILVGLVLCNQWLGKWACRVFHWHVAPSERTFDGCSSHGVCPRCGKEVMQDSNGDWF